MHKMVFFLSSWNKEVLVIVLHPVLSWWSKMSYLDLGALACVSAKAVLHDADTSRLLVEDNWKDSLEQTWGKFYIKLAVGILSMRADLTLKPNFCQFQRKLKQSSGSSHVSISRVRSGRGHYQCHSCTVQHVQFMSWRYCVKIEIVQCFIMHCIQMLLIVRICSVNHLPRYVFV